MSRSGWRQYASEFWRLLSNGVDIVRTIPADRWDGDAWYDPDLSAPAKSATKWGGFLDRIDEFDADYFGILPREAERMDPQQRLLLEVAIEAIDDAGLPQAQLRGSRTGVLHRELPQRLRTASVRRPRHHRGSDA